VVFPTKNPSVPSGLSAGGASEENIPAQQLRERLVNWSKTYLPAFVLGYTVTDVLVSAFIYFRASKTTVWRACKLALTVLFRKKVVEVAFWKIMTSKLLVGVALPIPAKRYLERKSKEGMGQATNLFHNTAWASRRLSCLGPAAGSRKALNQGP